MKRSRQKAILTILNQRRITTQEQLRDALLEQGIRVTQATLSRDIAELGLTKDENGYGLPRAIQSMTVVAVIGTVAAFLLVSLNRRTD